MWHKTPYLLQQLGSVGLIKFLLTINTCNIFKSELCFFSYLVSYNTEFRSGTQQITTTVIIVMHVVILLLEI